MNLPTEARKMVTAADLTKLGKYAEAVRKFTEKVAQFPEVKVVKVNSCEDYVDLWVVVEASSRAVMTRKIVDIFFETLAQFPTCSLT
jgi:F0F1-type ATP synthase gamma subunit